MSKSDSPSPPLSACSSGSTFPFPSAFDEALNRASHILKEAQPFQVITHGDVDGVAAGALVASAFECDVIIQKRLRLEGLDHSRFTLFLDLGNSQLEEIEKKFANFLVIDHHPGGEGDENVLNPWMYSIDGTRVLCAAAVTYLVIKKLGAEYNKLSYLGVVGILGDRQSLEGENSPILKDAKDCGILADNVLFGEYDLREFVDVVNACCRNGKKELASEVCALHNYEEGRKELDLYKRRFQEDLSYINTIWERIERENKGRSAYFIHDTNVTRRYAGELATVLAQTYGKPVIILVDDDEGVKISGRATAKTVQRGIDLGKAFKGFGGGHDIAAGAFLESADMVETFIQVADERLHIMVAPVTVRLDILVKDAEKVMKALAIDNEGYDTVEVTAEKGHILAKVEGQPGTVKNLTDDLIACLLSAVQMMEGE